MPKNYSCDSSSTKKSTFSVSFAFGIRALLKNGTIISKNTPITIFREKIGNSEDTEAAPEEQQGQDD